MTAAPSARVTPRSVRGARKSTERVATPIWYGDSWSRVRARRSTVNDVPHAHYCALDCPDPLALADFYAALTGGEVEELGDFPRDQVTWLEMMTPWNSVIGFQKIPHYEPPTWPEGPRPQQAHLDFLVADLAGAVHRAEELGARRAEYQPGETFVVLLDPAGHPFCLVRDSREGLSAVG